jgi:hypothetical protein
VANLNDVRAIPALLGVAYNGQVATSGLTRFGKQALPPTLRQVTGKAPRLSEGALFVVKDMLKYRTITDAESLAQIKNTLRVALANRDDLVRQTAIFVIEYLEDRQEFVPTLRGMANNDPFKLEGHVAEDGQDNGDVYPVRRVARLLLGKIAKNEPAGGQP